MNKSLHSQALNTWLTIPMSFMIAFFLTLLPMPDWSTWVRPAWILMVLVYWIIALPNYFGMGVAWMLGLFLDLINGSLLGEHALAMTVAAFFAVKMQMRFRLYPWMQQGVGILLMVFVYQFVLFCIQGFLGQIIVRWLYWLSPVISMLLWPWVYSVLRHCQRRFGPIQFDSR